MFVSDVHTPDGQESMHAASVASCASDAGAEHADQQADRAMAARGHQPARESGGTTAEDIPRPPLHLSPEERQKWIWEFNKRERAAYWKEEAGRRGDDVRQMSPGRGDGSAAKPMGPDVTEEDEGKRDEEEEEEEEQTDDVVSEEERIGIERNYNSEKWVGLVKLT